MLAIETVAAGGGSICEFDGVKLVVGPKSAGADPGPACYGRGGPLTVTDVNLFLGRILPERFPFPLDLAAVERRLTDLCERIASSALGRRYTRAELADGFVQIANANMVRAIRNNSVARGYDPADYVLVTFGGRTARVLGGPCVGNLQSAAPAQNLIARHWTTDVRRFESRCAPAVQCPDAGRSGSGLSAAGIRAVSEVRAEGISSDRFTARAVSRHALSRRGGDDQRRAAGERQ
jgi:5-oxoprolinase (ATP-hydrolysing)